MLKGWKNKRIGGELSDCKLLSLCAIHARCCYAGVLSEKEKEIYWPAKGLLAEGISFETLDAGFLFFPSVTSHRRRDEIILIKPPVA